MRIAPTPLVGHGQLTVVEREAAPPRTLSWLLESEQLRGRIESAALVERGTSKPLMTLPATPGVDDIALQGSAVPYTGVVPFDRFFDLARDERISLVLGTALPGQARLEFVLTLFEYKPWGQPYCS